MGFPSTGTEGIFRNPIEEVVKFFETYHKGHYRIFNLCSEKDYDHSYFNNNGKIILLNFLQKSRDIHLTTTTLQDC
jgi:hypothetical protein